ncbi:unnamed protein product [Effrenium voratum]|uniref:Ion transport domain-containing protein n=1 Tax=Effrenium voratum TaxID=2562239 RepID=A0AA36MUD3_9DINO|nr:unnamed protein product [Effrenium voratum]CAJ1386385.1 unnamed protein product [Effrenium voratum]
MSWLKCHGMEASTCRPSTQAWAESDQVHSFALPGCASEDAQVSPLRVGKELSQTLQEHQVSQSEQLLQWIAREEARAIEGQMLLEQLVRDSLSMASPGGLPPMVDSIRSTANGQSEEPEGLELLVLDGHSPTSPLAGEMHVPSAVRSSLRRHAAQQQNSLEEWSRRHERLRKQAYRRMQALLVGAERRPSLASLGQLQEASDGRVPSLSDFPDLPDTPNASAMKDIGETGGTPEVVHQETAPQRRTTFFPTKGMEWSRCIFVVLDDPEAFLIGKVISAFIITAILVSTATFILESMPGFQQRPGLCDELLAAHEPITKEACEPVPDPSFYYLEVVCISIFTLEYLVRLLTCHSDPSLGPTPLTRTLRYARMPLNIIDVLAVAPFYLGFALASVSSLRVLRLARVVRLFKLAKHHAGIRLCLEAMNRSGLTLAILMFFNVIVGIIFACVIFFIEGQNFSVDPKFTRPTVDALNNTVPAPHPYGVFVRKDAQGEYDVETPFRSIPISLWWVFTTMTTVGYGDMVPTTILGKIVGVLCFYCGVILLALPIGVLSSNFESAYSQARGMTTRTSRRTSRSMILARVHPSLIGTSMSMGHAITTRESRWFPETKSWAVMIFALLSDPGSSRAAKLVSWFVTAVILVTTVSMLLESMPAFSSRPAECKLWPEITLEDCRPRPGPAFEYVEAVCIIIFTIEYVLRVLLVHRVSPREAGLTDSKAGPLKVTMGYALQWLNLVDFFAIAPYYVSLSGLYQGSTAAVRVLRLVRVFRLLKSPRLRDGVDMIINIVGDSLPGILSVFSLTSIVCILFSSCLWICEGTEYSVTFDPENYPRGVYVRPTRHGYGVEPTPFTSITHCFWWFFVTATTVGYGDEFPTTTLGRLTAVGTFYAGIVLVAIKLTIVGRALKRRFPQYQAQ